MIQLIALVLTMVMGMFSGGIVTTPAVEASSAISYVGHEQTKLSRWDCVAVYTEYTNANSHSTAPEYDVYVKAFQHGMALSPLVMSEKTKKGYAECNTEIQAGATVNVVWYFEIDDDSPVTIEMTGQPAVEVDIGGK